MKRCKSSTSLVPCPRNGASWRAGVEWVRSQAFLSILGGYSSVIPNVQLVDFEEIQNRFSAACYGRGEGRLTRNRIRPCTDEMQRRNSKNTLGLRAQSWQNTTKILSNIPRQVACYRDSDNT